MATVIPQRQLRNDNAGILDRVEAGESFVVTRNGVAVADVIPHRPEGGPQRFPRASDVLALALREAAETAELDGEAWMQDIRDAGEFIDDDPLNDRG